MRYSYQLTKQEFAKTIADVQQKYYGFKSSIGFESDYQRYLAMSRDELLGYADKYSTAVVEAEKIKTMEQSLMIVDDIPIPTKKKKAEKKKKSRWHNKLFPEQFK